MVANGKIDPGLLKSMRWRCIGPHRGGRVVAAAGDPSDMMTFYLLHELEIPVISRGGTD